MSTGWEVTDYGVLDEAAALWEGGQLFDMAEQLGPKFGHTQIGGMTSLNRQIVDRIKKAQDIISLEQKACDNDQVHDLRIIVKEIISYMTAVLIQNLINSMLDGEWEREVDFFLHDVYKYGDWAHAFHCHCCFPLQ